MTAEARELPRDGILDALDKAIGRNKRRSNEAVYLLAEWTDVPDVVNRIGEWVKDPDPRRRSWLIQTIAKDGLAQFASHLHDIIADDPDEFCRDRAINAAGKLKSNECLPVLLRLAEDNDPKLTWRLATALRFYATVECQPHLQRWFDDASLEKSTRIFAAWGLGKLGDQTAIDYLIAMLDDPDERGDNYYRPGESLRAAQAVCDIFEWPLNGTSRMSQRQRNGRANKDDQPYHCALRPFRTFGEGPERIRIGRRSCGRKEQVEEGPRYFHGDAKAQLATGHRGK